MQKEEERIRAASKRENKQKRMRERSFTKTHIRASDLEPDILEDEVCVVTTNGVNQSMVYSDYHTVQSLCVCVQCQTCHLDIIAYSLI